MGREAGRAGGAGSRGAQPLMYFEIGLIQGRLPSTGRPEEVDANGGLRRETDEEE